MIEKKKTNLKTVIFLLGLAVTISIGVISIIGSGSSGSVRRVSFSNGVESKILVDKCIAYLYSQGLLSSTIMNR